MTAEGIAKALGGHRAGATWMARRPAHEDSSPSLAISAGRHGKVLVRCHAGCDQRDVIAALSERGLWDATGKRPGGVARKHRKNLSPDPDARARTDEAWRAIEIDASGWRIIDNPPVRFRRASGMKAMPIPVGGGSIETLRFFLNVQTGADFVLVVAWALACLRNRGPYPVIVLSGEQGSAKSTFSAILRALLGASREPHPSQQAFPHLRGSGRSPQPASRQRPAKGHGRARSRPCGQAVVGMVAAPGQPGGGVASKFEEQPHAKQTPHAPEPAMPCPNPSRDAVPIASDGEWALPAARRQGQGRAEGQ